MERPALSVIIPVYNGEAVISRTVHCIENNNEPYSLELLLVDDCSTDGTDAVCKELAAEFPNIRVIKAEKNGGVAASRQLGIRHATGTYLTFFDQDDIADVSYSSFLDLIQKNDADILVSNYYVEYNGRRTMPGEISAERIVEGTASCKVLAKGVLYKGYRVAEGVVLANTIWNCIFRRSLITDTDIRIRKYVDFEDDWLFLIETLSKAGRVILTPSAYYVWMISGQSQSHVLKYIPEFFEKYSAMKDKLSELTKNIGLSKCEERNYLNYVFSCAIVGEIKNDASLPRKEFLSKMRDLKKKISYKNVIDGMAANPHFAEKLHLAAMMLGLSGIWYSLYRRK